MNGVGVNIDGEGNVVGIWVDPEEVEADGFIYIPVNDPAIQALIDTLTEQE